MDLLRRRETSWIFQLQSLHPGGQSGSVSNPYLNYSVFVVFYSPIVFVPLFLHIFIAYFLLTFVFLLRIFAFPF